MTKGKIGNLESTKDEIEAETTGFAIGKIIGITEAKKNLVAKQEVYDELLKKGAMPEELQKALAEKRQAVAVLSAAQAGLPES